VIVPEYVGWRLSQQLQERRDPFDMNRLEADRVVRNIKVQAYIRLKANGYSKYTENAVVSDG
jgi:hypothetical protein